MAARKTTTRTTRVHLTAARAAEFTAPPGEERFLWDDDPKCLALRAQGGSVAYVFQKKLNGRAVRVVIGDRTAWDLDKARTEARRLAVLVDSKIDPRTERADRKAALDASEREKTRAVITLGEAWTRYVEARGPSWSAAHRHDHAQVMTEPGQERKRSTKKTAAGVLYALHAERLESLTAERLSDWLKTESEARPTVAARGFRLLRAFLRWASDQPDYRGLVDPAALLNGEVRRRVPRAKPKDDCIQREQVKPWFTAVRALGNPTISAYLQCLLLTGARPGELLRLRWDDLDFQWQAMTIRDKAEGERTIPLTPYVATLLAALPRRPHPTTGEPLPWVFSSVGAADGCLTEPNHPHSRAVAAAGLPNVTLHGLRRSFGTLSEWVEVPVGVVAQIQGHKPSAIAEKHYRRRPLDLLRKWHTKVEAWILAEAGLDQPPADAARLRAVS